MKGQQDVIHCLIALLRGELGARDQYFLHSRLYEDMGYAKLYERINHEMEEETQHADAILKRILFLEGKPDMRPSEIHPGYTVTDMLAADLKLEYEVRENLVKAITLCEQHRDYQTREILEVQLKDTEEDHAYWLEQQLRLIKLVGMENYLQSQM
ncbi:bacterioferritin [Halopseudomonas pelagia]|uniref:bacterioferritin n=1 Tax=Halopseudomonas pelagia TaxID=553151 RepID=UPI000399849E|nr:bacterioferritin [Halopseudomonas pelagia]|tara:strand:- start:422 stop:886 length:465 start_codon:yes stop_codon:yes gene_type:complete